MLAVAMVMNLCRYNTVCLQAWACIEAAAANCMYLFTYLCTLVGSAATPNWLQAVHTCTKPHALWSRVLPWKENQPCFMGFFNGEAPPNMTRKQPTMPRDGFASCKAMRSVEEVSANALTAVGLNACK